MLALNAGADEPSEAHNFLKTPEQDRPSLMDATLVAQVREQGGLQ